MVSISVLTTRVFSICFGAQLWLLLWPLFGHINGLFLSLREFLFRVFAVLCGGGLLQNHLFVFIMLYRVLSWLILSECLSHKTVHKNNIVCTSSSSSLSLRLSSFSSHCKQNATHSLHAVERSKSEPQKKLNV